jgi:hypothetical protein
MPSGIYSRKYHSAFCKSSVTVSLLDKSSCNLAFKILLNFRCIPWNIQYFIFFHWTLCDVFCEIYNIILIFFHWTLCISLMRIICSVDVEQSEMEDKECNETSSNICPQTFHSSRSHNRKSLSLVSSNTIKDEMWLVSRNSVEM